MTYSGLTSTAPELVAIDLDTLLETLDRDVEDDALTDDPRVRWTETTSTVTQTSTGEDDPYVPQDLGVASAMGGDPGSNWPSELKEPVVIEDALLDALPPEVQAEAASWQKQQDNTCAPTAVTMLVSEFYGQPVDAGLFVDQARQPDLVAADPARPQDALMYPADLPELLATFGVQATHVCFPDSASAESGLQQALASGSGEVGATPYLQAAVSDDAPSALASAVQPAIAFDQGMADTGRPVWLLPVTLGADALGIDLGRR